VPEGPSSVADQSQSWQAFLADEREAWIEFNGIFKG